MARGCLSRKELAKAAGMHEPSLCNLLSGANVRPATIGKVAKALGVDVLDILADETSKT